MMTLINFYVWIFSQAKVWQYSVLAFTNKLTKITWKKIFCSYLFTQHCLPMALKYFSLCVWSAFMFFLINSHFYSISRMLLSFDWIDILNSICHPYLVWWILVEYTCIFFSHFLNLVWFQILHIYEKNEYSWEWWTWLGIFFSWFLYLSFIIIFSQVYCTSFNTTEATISFNFCCFSFWLHLLY